MKGFADNECDMDKNMKFVFWSVENIEGKEEMLVTRIFFFSHNVFKRLSSQGR